MATANYWISEYDGWVEIAPANSEVRVSGVPHNHPYYLYAGGSSPSETGSYATGTVILSSTGPVDGDTVTIGSEVYTFVNSAANPFEVEIGVSITETGDNFEAAVLADSSLISASNAAGTITITSVLPGTQGNYALSKNATDVAVSGANMTGGVDAVEGILMCHHPFQTTNPMTDKLYARIVNSVPNSKNNGKLRLDVFTIIP